MTDNNLQEDMTTESTETAPAPDAVDTVTEQPEPDNTEQAPDGNNHPGREAAKYRTQLREVEGERDGLQAKVTALQRNAALSIASNRLHVADDLFNVGGIDVEQLTNDDGTIDPDKVQAAVDELIASRPGLGKTAAPPSQQPREIYAGTSKPGGSFDWINAMKRK